MLTRVLVQQARERLCCIGVAKQRFLAERNVLKRRGTGLERIGRFELGQSGSVVFVVKKLDSVVEVPARFGQRLLWRLCVRCGPWSVGLGRAGDGEADDPRDAAPPKPHRGAPAEAHGPSVFSRNWPAMPELTGAAL